MLPAEQGNEFAKLNVEEAEFGAVLLEPRIQSLFPAYVNVKAGREFWLPKTFLTEITERDPRRTGTFVAEYTSCKRFTAEVTIRVQE